MKFLIIDTCVWLDLAENPPLRALLQELQTALRAKVRQLVLPGPVRLEYNRNRARLSESWVKSLQGHINHLNGLKKILGPAKDEIARIQKAGNAAIAEAKKSVPLNLVDIESIFKAARIWEAEEAHFKDACERNLNFKPPAHVPQRSSVGDCLIWAAVLDLLNEGEVWFCSANSRDFSKPERNDHAHPDLVTEAAAKGYGFRYFNNPTKLVEELLRELPKTAKTAAVHLPKYFDYVLAPPGKCPKCDDKFYENGAFLNSAYGGLTLQYICRGCGFRFDTGDSFD